jgi:hypothetical protein
VFRRATPQQVDRSVAPADRAERDALGVRRLAIAVLVADVDRIVRTSTFSRALEVSKPSTTPQAARSASIASTPSNRRTPCASRIIARKSCATRGSFHAGRRLRLRTSDTLLRRSDSTSSGCTFAKPCFSASTCCACMKNGKLSASVPSKSKIASR